MAVCGDVGRGDGGGARPSGSGAWKGALSMHVGVIAACGINLERVFGRHRRPRMLHILQCRFWFLRRTVRECTSEVPYASGCR